jgi:hypothetical protein
VAWDFRPPPQERPIGTHKFLTRVIVKVEITLSDPRAAALDHGPQDRARVR